MERIVAGRALWHGSFTEGTGTLATQTSDTIPGARYTFASRFEGAPGAIPEELLATGHAGCYNHALANIARRNHITVQTISTSAELTMGGEEHGYTIEGVHLVTDASLDTSEEKFREIAEQARVGCAFSKALRVPITLDATFSAPTVAGR
jgi:lipoyl-dependent peroxiredoxin